MADSLVNFLGGDGNLESHSERAEKCPELRNLPQSYILLSNFVQIKGYLGNFAGPFLSLTVNLN